MEGEDQQMQHESNSEKKSVGPVIGIIIIVAIIVIGGFYLWGQRLVDTGKDVDDIVEELENVSDSDEIADIETDLNATDIDSIDEELDDIEAELDNL